MVMACFLQICSPSVLFENVQPNCCIILELNLVKKNYYYCCIMVEKQLRNLLLAKKAPKRPIEILKELRQFPTSAGCLAHVVRSSVFSIMAFQDRIALFQSKSNGLMKNMNFCPTVFKCLV